MEYVGLALLGIAVIAAVMSLFSLPAWHRAWKRKKALHRRRLEIESWLAGRSPDELIDPSRFTVGHSQGMTVYEVIDTAEANPVHFAPTTDLCRLWVLETIREEEAGSSPGPTADP